jgi:MYXO-CTERM domain-containing protein
MRRLLIGSLVFAAALSAAAVTQAHIALLNPPPRHSELKTGPCGVANDTRGDIITVLEPGAALTVTWDETIEHPGHFRILFDEDGFDFQDYPTVDGPIPAGELCTPGTVTDGVHCLAENIPDQPGGPNYSYDVTLPDIPCENCTLQVIQFMTDKLGDGSDNEFYYQCADLVLQAGAGGGSTTSSTTTTSSGSGTTTSSGSGTGGEGGDTGGGALPTGDDGCGCHVAGADDGTTSMGIAAALGLLAAAMRRRRAAR